MEKYDSHSSRTTALDDPEGGPEGFERDKTLLEGLSAKLRKTGEVRRPARAGLRRMQGESPSRECREAGSEDRASGDDASESEFLRAPRRVSVRRRRLPSGRAGRSLLVAAGLLIVVAGVLLVVSVRNFFRESPLFRIDSASSIQIAGNSVVTRAEVLSVFGSDIGRNIFFLPLEARRDELNRLPWVKNSTVMRILPNQIRVSIEERVPIAFVRQGSTIGLVDAAGVLLHMPSAGIATRHYSFPVVTGIRARDTLQLRAARMHLYQQFLSAIDAGGVSASAKISEIDLTDPEDVRASLPSGSSEIVAHFGDSDFPERYRRYAEHIEEWQRQYPRLRSVDLRYANQVVLDMAPEPAPQRKEEVKGGPRSAVHRTAKTTLRANTSHAASGRPAATVERKR